MKLLEKLPKVELHEIGEFRMGAIGYGVVIRTAYGVIDFLKDEPTVIGSTLSDNTITFSDDDRYIKINCPDVIFIVDSKYQKVSIYRITVHAGLLEPGNWFEGTVSSSENCVYGRQVTHINGFKEGIYLQCPWVKQCEVLHFVRKYQCFREKQLDEALNISTAHYAL